MWDLTRSLFSLEERRISTLIVVFIFFSLVGGYKVVTKGDIPPNLVSVLLGLITAIGTVNAVGMWADRNNKIDYQGSDINAQNGQQGYGGYQSTENTIQDCSRGL